MAPNSENPMALLLFAILKQHNLKNVNWDKVAQDTDLPEPISNGHAARMRFFRFRESVQGQARKKNRSASADSSKSRVAKPKKPQATRRNVVIKSELDSSLSPYGQYSPASTTSPYLGDTMDEFEDRFTTPPSDDMSITSGRKPSIVDPVVVPDNFGPFDPSVDLFSTAGSDFDSAFTLYDTERSCLPGPSSLGFSEPHVLGDNSAPDWMSHMQ